MTLAHRRRVEGAAALKCLQRFRRVEAEVVVHEYDVLATVVGVAQRFQRADELLGVLQDGLRALGHQEHLGSHVEADAGAAVSGGEHHDELAILRVRQGEGQKGADDAHDCVVVCFGCCCDVFSVERVE